MWLQPTEEIAEHAKDNDDWEAIITRELKIHLKRLPGIKNKTKERRRDDSQAKKEIRDFWAERERENY